MSYATVQSMVGRFGETEVLRLSQPEDRSTETIFVPKVELALADASSLVNDYLRGRYTVPVVTAPDSIVRATCVLARYDLAKSDRSEPTEQMRLDRKETIAFLEKIADGTVSIDAPAAGSPMSDGGARIQDRDAAFSNDTLRGW